MHINIDKDKSQDRVEWDPEQFILVGGIPAHGRWVGAGCSLRSFPAQPFL